MNTGAADQTMSPHADLSEAAGQPQITSRHESHLRVSDILEEGDLVLDVDCGTEYGRILYRAGVHHLRNASRYFDTLLDPNRYQEGGTVQDVHQQLLQAGLRPSQASVDRLPRIRMSDVGPVTPANSFHTIFADLLRIIHGLDVQTQRPSLTYFANLGALADRFDCLETVAQHVKNRNMLQALSGKNMDRTSILIPEERTRQRILVGWFLDQPEWLFNSSKRLILGGSCLWHDVDVSEGCDRGVWWDLPDGLEGNHSLPLFPYLFVLKLVS